MNKLVREKGLLARFHDGVLEVVDNTVPYVLRIIYIHVVQNEHSFQFK